MKKSQANSVTHQAPTVCFVYEETLTVSLLFGRTDTMCVTNDHLLGPSLEGQQSIGTGFQMENEGLKIIFQSLVYEREFMLPDRTCFFPHI